MGDSRNLRNYGCGKTLNAFTIRNLSRQTSELANRGDALSLKTQSALTDFSRHLRSEFGIRFLEKIEKYHLESWAEHLHDRLIEGSLTTSTTSSYVSCINTVFSTHDRHDLKISAKGFGIARGQKHSNQNLSNSQASQKALKQFCLDQYLQTHDIKLLSLFHSVTIQSEAGLRFRESTQIKIAVKNLSGNHLHLVKGDGVKNSQPRSFKPSSMSGLRQAKIFVQDNSVVFHRGSLIPGNLTYKEYQTWAYKQLAEFREQNPAYKNYHFHGNRHSYAHKEFQKLWENRVGIKIPSPVTSGNFGKDYINRVSLKTGMRIRNVSSILRQINLEVAEKLGHHRVDSAFFYCGK